MIATWSAGEGMQAKPLLQQYKIPAINYSTAWEILQPPVDYMYCRSAATSSIAMQCSIISLPYTKARRTQVGLLTYNNPYGRSIQKPSEEYAKQKNIDIVTIENSHHRRGSLHRLLRFSRRAPSMCSCRCSPQPSSARSRARTESTTTRLHRHMDIHRPDFFKNGQVSSATG